jgi:hypothetical protein
MSPDFQNIDPHPPLLRVSVSPPPQQRRGIHSARGLQCYKLNGNKTENDRYWQKITCYFLQNV